VRLWLARCPCGVISIFKKVAVCLFLVLFALYF
jgi:hypothetical protein